MTPDEKKLIEEAKAFARRNKRAIAARVTDTATFPTEQHPVSVFMAGSPGAGKTEASKALVGRFEGKTLRVDADELRFEFQSYNGRNSWLFQAAVSILVDKVIDNALNQQQSFVLDGTLTNEAKAESNIARSLKRKRPVQILYVYQDPLVAWEFVREREVVEGRRIELTTFVDQYFRARDCVNSLKRKFGKAIKVDLLLQNNDNSAPKFYQAVIDQIDSHIPEKYERDSLEMRLRAL